MSSDKELPLIIFITSQMCGHCIQYRGRDGNPTNERDWNYSRIRRLLNYPQSRFKKLNASAIVEFNISSNNNRDDNIREINIYSCIPSIEEIKRYTKSMKSEADFKYFDPAKIPGSVVERIKISRGTFHKLTIDVEVNDAGETSHSPYLTKFYNDEYIWDRVPLDIKMMRDFLNKKGKIPISVLQDLKNDVEENRSSPEITMDLLNDIVVNLDEIHNDHSFFDRLLTEKYFNFKWFLRKNFTNQIRKYEKYYPMWMIVSPSEWRESVQNGTPLYARVVGNHTEMNGSSVSLKPFSNYETIDSLLEEYHKGNVSLHFEERSESRYSWQS